MKLLLALIFICLGFLGHSQYVLKGKVTDQYEEGIPGARIYIQNSTYGVISNYNGDYFFELKKAGTYQIVYSM